MSGLSTLMHSSEMEDRYAGIRLLWAKAILRAINDYVSYKDSNKIGLKKYAESAQRWLFFQDESYNSLDNVCQMLGISSERVRNRAMTMTKDEIAKVEYIDRTSGPKSNFLTGKIFLSSCRVTLVSEFDNELFEEA